MLTKGVYDIHSSLKP